MGDYMNEISIKERADRIRDVIRYISKFKNSTVVIYIDDRIIDSSLFSNHIHDIFLMKEAGLKVILVPGAHKRINEVLSANNINWTIKNKTRITEPDAMTLIKMAAFEVANNVMTSLASVHITAVIGNWVRARGKGVISGIDYGTAGEIDKIDEDSINTVLNNGFIPIFPCIGWSLNGKPYNISSMHLSSQIATKMNAEKLFFLIPDIEISDKNFTIPKSIGISPEGHIPAMNIEELDLFMSENIDKKTIDTNNISDIISALELSKYACSNGVSRTHLLNGFFNGALPCEIFSNLGAGTMIYSYDYGKIRSMHREDISQVLSLIRPFVIKEILLPRTEKDLEKTFNDYIVYEIDGSIRACAALHIYDRNQAEIAAVAVDENCSHIGIGPKLIEYLIQKAKIINIKSIFLLTTKTADWFENLGFKSDSIDTLPQKRKEILDKKRGSKVLRLILN